MLLHNWMDVDAFLMNVGTVSKTVFSCTSTVGHHWFHQRQKKREFAFLIHCMTELRHKHNEYIFAIQNSVLWYTCLWLVLFFGIVRNLSALKWNIRRTFKFPILNHHPWSHLKLNYEPNSTLIFIISILTYFSEVQFSALFLVLFILLTQLLWLNISSFIWLNVKLNTAFATVVFTVTVKSKKNISPLRSLSSKLPCSSVSINTLESN